MFCHVESNAQNTNSLMLLFLSFAVKTDGEWNIVSRFPVLDQSFLPCDGIFGHVEG
jgi:hypothetical protein